MDTRHRGSLAPAPSRWRHPFDSAGSTIALGVSLTVVLMLALRLLGG
jgi:hypothetical protein